MQRLWSKSKKRRKKPYSVVSLFSGALGLDIGVERAGDYQLLACVELEPSFRETITLNRDRGRVGSPDMRIYGDILQLQPEQLLKNLSMKPGDLDLLIGGPPCQAFSTAGRRRGTEDPRGTLMWHFLDFVSVLRPRAFLMENVRGVVSTAWKGQPTAAKRRKRGASLSEDEKPGSLLRMFASDLRERAGADYRMDAFEVNSVNYGAPQIRERLLCIGNRMGRTIEFPEPTHARDPDEAAAGAAQLGPRERQEPPPALKPWRTLRDAIGDLEEAEPELLDFSPRKKRFLSMVPPGSNWRSLPKVVQEESMGRAFHAKGGRSGWWRRLTFDLPSPTLVTMPNHASTSLCHPTETRALSLREYARIQEFPDEWEFAGTTAQRYRQVGNAVPVRLGQVAGEVLATALQRGDVRDATQQPDAADKGFRLVYLQSHVRTRQWYKAGETFVWNDGAQSNPTYADPVTVRKVRSLSSDRK